MELRNFFPILKFIRNRVKKHIKRTDIKIIKAIVEKLSLKNLTL